MAPDQAPRKGKYNSERDELLHRMALDGWAVKSSGDAQAVTGWFARISNAPDELAEIRDALAGPELPIGSAVLNALQGHFLLVEDDQGFVEVTSYEAEQDLLVDYTLRDALYQTGGGAS